jgi:hypothetical protein
MTTLTQSIATYSFVDRPTLNLGTLNENDSDIALLVRVNALMTEAAASFNARQYDLAIGLYQAAESLIYSTLDPEWVPELGSKLRPMLPRNPELFAPLLSATSQWLNIMPVNPPVSPVRPTTPVDEQLLSPVANLHDAGLSVVSTDPAKAFDALADMRLAQIYADQGNAKASASMVSRARKLDPTIARALEPTTITPVKPETPLRAVKAIVTHQAGPSAEPAAEGGAVHTTSATPAAASTTVATNVRAIETLPTLPTSVLAEKQVGLLTGSAGQYAIKTVGWAADASPSTADITNLIYSAHAMAPRLPDAMTNVSTIWERAVFLPHDYFYVIPLALAQCYEAMGDYPNAETYYLQAASYTYINTAVEGPYAWLHLATLYSKWGDSLYQQGDLTEAATQYGKVLTIGSTTPPSTPLYTLAGLTTAANIATALIPQLPTFASSGVSTVSPDDVAIASVLLKIYAKLTQINAGLDFWGNYANAVPIWSFVYLQQLATNFAQYALGAEQEVINFWSQADQATLTQIQLSNQVAQANAQVGVASLQLAQAQAQAMAYQAGVTLAQTRATDAGNDATQYQSMNSQAILAQAESQQILSGSYGNPQQLSTWASQWMSGQGNSGGGYGAAVGLAASEYSQAYQLYAMNGTTTEMQQAATEAQDQLTAANAQVNVQQAGLAVANLDAIWAQAALDAFDANTFTPQVWRSMGDYVLGIYERYMSMALATAKLMQQAYNFENDTSVTYIKDSYSGVVEGLLGADALMADIQQFSYDLITAKRGKKQYVQTSISLAQKFGYLFQTKLVSTGTMTFETTLDHFDSVFPGSYGGRIQSVTVDIQGIVPPRGISGSLTNGGISFYRLPSDIATPTNPSKVRIQNPDTLILSDYSPATQPQLNSLTGNQLGIFEGAGVASTWTLSLPPPLNDMNYAGLTDVVLTFLYETRFDPQLVPTVLAQLASHPGYYDREWAIPLAWLYPDLFFAFTSTGTLTLSLSAADFPFNETSPVITAVTVLLAMTGSTSPEGVTLTLTPPGLGAVTGVTDASGAVTSQGSGGPWAAAVGGSAYGDWVITLPVASNPALAPGGVLNLSSLLNMVLILDYSFTPRS